MECVGPVVVIYRSQLDIEQLIAELPFEPVYQALEFLVIFHLILPVPLYATSDRFCLALQSCKFRAGLIPEVLEDACNGGYKQPVSPGIEERVACLDN